MRDVIGRYGKNILKMKKCPDTLLFFIILGMFRRNFTRIGQIYICYKFAQSERTPQNQLRDFSS